MSKFTRVQKIMLVMIAVLLAFALLTNGKGSKLKSLVYDPFVMLKYSIVDYPVETMKNWIQDFNDLWAAKEENDELRRQLANMEQTSALIENLTRENEELKQLIGSEVSGRYQKVYAHIVNRNPEVYNNIITINAGSNQNVQLDNAVISSQGLIGKVIEVNDSTSRVRLLTSQDQLSKVAVQIHINDQEVLHGYLEQFDIEKQAYKVRLFTNTDRVKPDLNVTSSGAGGVFPSGLYVGKVQQVEDLLNENGRIVYVTPAMDFSSFEYVAVLCEVQS